MGKRPSVELGLPDGDELTTGDGTQDSPDRPRDSTAGNAAILTAVMGGITGLMGALTQVVVAFLQMRSRRRPGAEIDDEESEQG
jgi:hypothetical protein